MSESNYLRSVSIFSHGRPLHFPLKVLYRRYPPMKLVLCAIVCSWHRTFLECVVDKPFESAHPSVIDPRAEHRWRGPFQPSGWSLFTLSGPHALHKRALGVFFKWFPYAHIKQLQLVCHPGKDDELSVRLVQQWCHRVSQVTPKSIQQKYRWEPRESFMLSATDKFSPVEHRCIVHPPFVEPLQIFFSKLVAFLQNLTLE